MKKKIILILFLSSAFSQAITDKKAIKSVRLENFVNNYTGKIIRFLGQENIYIQGELIGSTSEAFIVLVEGSSSSYSNKGIKYVYVIPEKTEFLLALGVSFVGGVISYLTLIVNRENPQNPLVGVTIVGGVVLGGIIGKNTFYKPIKIDISGNIYD
tara:strand:- start:1321 stop:1788 length:468 start_codon:yes stop_codon:yes gene_type:complete